MTTTGTYTNTTTLDTILKDAYGLIGVYDDREVLDPSMEKYGIRTLNTLMSVLSTHKGLWLVEDVSFTLTPGTQSYTVGVGLDINTPLPFQVAQGRRSVSASLEIPMEVVPRSEYMAQPNKATQAPPLVIYYDKRRDNGVLYVWPTGDANEKDIIITTQRPVQDFTDSGDNPDLPKEWVMPITYLLAVKLAPKYLGGIVPPDIKQEAAELLSVVIQYDEEKSSLFFSPGGR